MAHSVNAACNMLHVAMYCVSCIFFTAVTECGIATLLVQHARHDTTLAGWRAAVLRAPMCCSDWLSTPVQLLFAALGASLLCGHCSTGCRKSSTALLEVMQLLLDLLLRKRALFMYNHTSYRWLAMGVMKTVCKPCGK